MAEKRMRSRSTPVALASSHAACAACTAGVRRVDLGGRGWGGMRPAGMPCMGRARRVLISLSGTPFALCPPSPGRFQAPHAACLHVLSAARTAGTRVCVCGWVAVLGAHRKAASASADADELREEAGVGCHPVGAHLVVRRLRLQMAQDPEAQACSGAARTLHTHVGARMAGPACRACARPVGWLAAVTPVC